MRIIAVGFPARSFFPYLTEGVIPYGVPDGSVDVEESGGGAAGRRAGASACARPGANLLHHRRLGAANLEAPPIYLGTHFWQACPCRRKSHIGARHDTTARHALHHLVPSPRRATRRATKTRPLPCTRGDGGGRCRGAEAYTGHLGRRPLGGTRHEESSCGASSYMGGGLVDVVRGTALAYSFVRKQACPRAGRQKSML